MVEDHVGDGADALAVKGADHRQQFRLVAKRTVVVGKPVLGVIAHRSVAATTGALRNPHQLEKFGQFIGLRCKVSPPAVVI